MPGARRASEVDVWALLFGGLTPVGLGREGHQQERKRVCGESAAAVGCDGEPFGNGSGLLSWQRICLQCRRASSIPGSGRSSGEGIGDPLQCAWASLVAQLVKNPLAMQETWVRFLGWEDPLEKGKATHSSVLARVFHGLHSAWGCKELDTTEQLSLSLSLI